MGNIKEWWSAHRPTTRRLAQLYCALLYNAHVKGFIEGEIFVGNTKAMCVPGFNCYSCPGAIGACPLGSLQNALATSGTRAGTYMIGILLLFGVTLGRTICGWLCPLGMLQELLHKIPTPKIRKNRVTRVLSYLKYVILGVFVLAIPMWYGIRYDLPVPGFCKYICPAGTSEGAMGLLSNPKNSSMFNMLNILFTRKFTILVIIIGLCIFCYRAFCRFICPLGAIYGLFNRFAIIGVKVNPTQCTHCGNCVRSCQMDVRHVGDHECISCGECMNVCAAGAISLKAGGFTLKAPVPSAKAMEADPGLEQTLKKRRRNGRIAWGVAIAALAGVLVYINIILPGQEKEASAADPAMPAVSQTSDIAGSDASGADSDAKDTGKSDKPEGDHAAAGMGETEAAGADETEAADTEKDTEKTDSADDAKESKETESSDAAKDADKTESADAAKGADETEAADTEKDAGETDSAGDAKESKENESGDAAKDADKTESADAIKDAEASDAAVSYESSAPVGYSEGDQLKDFEAELVDGGTFHLKDMRGKIVIINRWATWCPSCVAEIPYFCQVSEENPDVYVLLVHGKPIMDGLQEFLDKKQWGLDVVADSDNKICEIVNGSATLPQTTVLNARGEVVYNLSGSVTYEKLRALVEKARQSV